MAFKIAGSLGFKEACKRANPIILEPIMKLEVEVPDRFLGDVMGDISRRRGNVSGTNSVGKDVVINAEVPLSELFGYVTDLRSNTQGLGVYQMAFSHYAEVPRNVAETIIGARAKKD